MAMCTRSATHAARTVVDDWSWLCAKSVGVVHCTVEQKSKRVHVSKADLETPEVQFFPEIFIFKSTMAM